MLAKAVNYLGHAARTAKVRTKTSEAVVNDVRMRIVEAGQHCRSLEIHDSGARPLQVHQLGSASRQDLSARDHQVAFHLEPGARKRANDSAGEDQVCLHARLD